MIRRPLEKFLVQALVISALGGLYGHAMAQDTPFDQPAANEVDNPFAENNNTADSPFASDSSAADPFAPTFGEDTNATSSPFADPSVDNPFASNDAGGAVGSPFGGEAAVADPLGNNAAAPVDSPFGGSATATADPFGSTATTESPFGGETAGAANPFAGTPDTTADPFGGTPADTAANPFGAPDMTAGTTTADPFGGSTADPFGGSMTDDPFGGGNDPFGGGNDPLGGPPLSGGPAGAAMGTGAGISQLYQFRYLKVRRWDQTEVVVRKRMTEDEANDFDAKIINFYQGLADNDELPGYSAASNDSEEWSQWMLYANQLELWSEYCSKVVLIGADYEFDPKLDIMWPGDPRDEEDQEDSGRPQRPDNIYNENRSLDDQLADFSPIPDTRSGSQGNEVIDPEEMNKQATGIYQDFLTVLRDQEEIQRLYIVQLKNDLDKRKQRREAYAEWRESLKMQLKDYVEEWARRYDGKIVNIAGVRYELYKPGDVPDKVHRNAHIVETEYGLTPYDLLNDDGSIRLPE